MRAYLSRTSAPTPVLIRAANGFQIILGKVRPNTSPGREPSTSSDHCSKRSCTGEPLLTFISDEAHELQVAAHSRNTTKSWSACSIVSLDYWDRPYIRAVNSSWNRVLARLATA